MTAECESPVVLHRRFVVTYTLINNLQDFLAVRLVWTPESAAAGEQGVEEGYWEDGMADSSSGRRDEQELFYAWPICSLLPTGWVWEHSGPSGPS